MTMTMRVTTTSTLFVLVMLCAAAIAGDSGGGGGLLAAVFGGGAELSPPAGEKEGHAGGGLLGGLLFGDKGAAGAETLGERIIRNIGRAGGPPQPHPQHHGKQVVYEKNTRPAYELGGRGGGGLGKILGEYLPNTYYSRPKVRYPYYDHTGKGYLLYGYGGKDLYEYSIFKPLEGYF